MKIRSVVSIPKEEDFPEANEDNFLLRDDKVSCALSDGASESFDSQAWSEILCQSFNFVVKRKKRGSFLHEKTIEQILSHARSSFNEKYLKKTLSWSQEASFNRGSFATILGLIDHGTTVEIFSVGDSVAVWNQNDRLTMLSMHNDYNFNKKPTLLSTLYSEKESFFPNFGKDWDVLKLKKKEIKNDELFLLSDAIASRIIEISIQDTVDDAINILKKNDEELKDWINKEKNLGLLKKDDYTIVWVELND